MLGMQWVLELFLQMDKGARRLNQAFEIIRVFVLCFQPKMFEHIVRFVVALLVPATKKTAIEWMVRDIGRSFVGRLAFQLGH